MFNVYKDKKFIASFERLKDARSYVSSVLLSEYSRRGFELVCVNFPRRGEPYIYTFGKKGIYEVVTVYRVL